MLVQHTKPTCHAKLKFKGYFHTTAHTILKSRALDGKRDPINFYKTLITIFVYFLNLFNNLCTFLLQLEII